MTRVICISTKGAITPITVGQDYYFDNFVAKNPYTGDTFGGLYLWDGAELTYLGLTQHKLFKKVKGGY